MAAASSSHLVTRAGDVSAAVMTPSTLASALDSADGDMSAFLNSLLPGPPSAARPPDLAPLDKQLGDLLTQVSLLSQDTSSALEQVISDITRTVPRLTYDLQFMRESATSLQSSLSHVQDRVRRQSAPSINDTQRDALAEGRQGRLATTEEESTRAALDKLAHLDTLKTRMESARDILREAESWSTLEGEVASYVSAGEWPKAADRLAEASRSLVVFQNTPGEYESRRTLLVSLQNQLEAALSAALKDALAAVDADRCAQFFRIFQTMDRTSEFRSYYFDARRAPVIDEWSSAALVEAGVAGGARFSAWLPRFYATFLATINVERVQIPLVFGATSASTLTSFIHATLDALSPSLHDRLGAVADLHGAEALPELLRCLRATEELSAAVHATLDKLDGVNLDTASPPPSSAKAHISHRFSQAPASTSSSLDGVMFEPFFDMQASYPALERRYLSHLRISDPALSDRSSRALTERFTTAFAFADSAIERCLTFTHGYGAPGLVDATDSFLSAAIAETSLDARDATPAKDELDFDGLEYSTQDWASFQLGLHVLRACRGLSERLVAFESNLQDFVRRVDTDAPTLLRESPLNSAALHAAISAPPRLKSAHEALTAFTRTVQQFLQSTILAPLQSQLDAYPSLSTWTQPERVARRGELSVPTFSLSPTDTIARVAEGLLNLLRVFEVYASDDALAFTMETLPHVGALPPSVPDSAVDPDNAASVNAGAPETVLSTWVSSLALSLLAHMTSQTLPSLRGLSGPGAAQLASDLAYLSNAVRALDVEWEDLEKWREAAEADEATWRAKRVDRVWAQVGRLRGWA